MIYKLNFGSVIKKLLLISFVFSILFCIVIKNFNWIVYLISFLIIIFIEVFLFFFQTIVFKIIIEESTNVIYLYFRKWMIVDSLAIIHLNDLSFSYKYEIGARGIKSKELRFYNDKKEKLIGVGKGFDGWDKAVIQEIIDQLSRLNVEKLC